MSSLADGNVALRLLDILNTYFSYEEFREMVFQLGEEFEELQGASKREKSRELIIYLERRDRLPDLINWIKHNRPDVDLSYLAEKPSDQLLLPLPITGQLNVTQEGDTLEATGMLTGNTPTRPVYQRDIIGLQNEVAGLRQQTLELITRLENSDSQDKPLSELADEIIRAANRAVGRTEDLKADLILPSAELRQIRMIPEHQVERLEEYRSDENLAFLLIGLFAGAAVGIIVNWATDSTFSPTPISVTLLLLFSLLAIGAALWSYRLKRRVNSIYRRLPQTLDKPSRS